MKYIIPILTAIIIISCKNEIKVIFPDSVWDEVTQYIQTHNYIVVIYVDSSNCAPCSLRNLDFWNPRKKELNDNNTGVLLVIHNSDEQQVNNTLKTLDISFPFIFDKGRKFKAKNIGIFGMAHDNTFVMDKDRKMVFSGSPIASEEKWKSFVKFVKH
jgi:hypothetical protein